MQVIYIKNRLNKQYLFMIWYFYVFQASTTTLVSWISKKKLFKWLKNHRNSHLFSLMANKRLMTGVLHMRGIVFLDLWTWISLSMLLPTSKIVSLWVSRIERNYLSFFLICKPSYLPHIKLHELVISLQGLIHLRFVTCQIWEHWSHPYWWYTKSLEFSVLMFFDRNIDSAANAMKLKI